MDIESKLPRIIQSLRYFLLHYAYQKDGGAAQTLSQHYPLLVGPGGEIKITPGYPGDVSKLNVPHLAVDTNIQLGDEPRTFSPVEVARDYSFSIYGFAGGEAKSQDNLPQRDNLKSDLHLILEEIDQIPYYTDPPDFSAEDGAFEIIDVSSRNVKSISYLDAERYRFVVDFTVKLVSIEQ